MHEKYIENFLMTDRVTEKETYINLFNKLESIDRFMIEWENEDLDNFMKEIGSTSVNTINKYLQFIREFYRYCCEQEGVKPKNLELTYEVKRYIDFNEFSKKTLSRAHYKYLKNELGGEYNNRDKALLMLAWEGLTNSDIKNLREEDILFYYECGKQKAKLFIRKGNQNNRIVIIEDEELVETLKKTISETEYLKIEESGRGRQYPIKYKQTPMLIKPVAIRQSNKDEVANPSMLLNSVLKKLDGIIPEIDLTSLSLEDIRRSRIIDLFRQGLDIQDVKRVFDKKTECDLGWLYEVTTLIRRKEKEKENEKK